VISVLPHKRRGMLDSMVRWYQERHLSLLEIDAPKEWGYR
jgi:hypothetical protein